LLNASVGVQRALSRLRPATVRRSQIVATAHRRSLAVASSLRVRRTSVHPRTLAAPGHHRASPRRRTLPVLAMPSLAGFVTKVGTDRVLPVVVAAIVLVASLISALPTMSTGGAVGGTTGDGTSPRIAIAGRSGEDGGQSGTDLDVTGDGSALGNDAATGGDGSTGGDGAGEVAGALGFAAADDLAGDPAGESGALGIADPTADGTDPTAEAIALDDGTLFKPVAVNTTVDDGRDVLRTYRVRSGDTLTGIARKFDVSMMTIWWANNLRSKDDLHIGQTLTIPPVSGLVVTVGASDSLDTLAARFGVRASAIVDANQLDDPNLVIGQTLTIPGAQGAGIATPKPAAKPAPKATTRARTSTTSGRPPARYSGGRLSWPVAGGSISQYYHYGHYAIDIQADYGTRVKAAAAGTVIFAGWKNNGGGYQVWIAHGSNLYTTYNHMSAVSVGRGQRVARGQQVGRVGATGFATGPHLHFEVWIGPVWNGGRRVNPLAYL
jgi:murein DD-endopeptidase MepM/ murein hydrolase activator NlpD